ncbi:MAG TPA: hypothetical protein VGX68_09620 [Thermoanaerobaculia bacterium]|jgi:hypothetical protein|nr:hypothetical protein [Thermoanaerobaculia bacterium]
MSYLDVPRLHFAGTFMANPSTINNTPTNYDPSRVNPSSPISPGLDLSWNPYGSHAWTISAQVTSFVDTSGQVHTGGDPLIGATFASYMPQQVPAKLVDLDTEQQGVTRLFGLDLQLVLTGGETPSLRGRWENGGTLVNLWLNRVPSQQGDSAAGGAFQSVLQNLRWADVAGSALLQQLQDAAGAGLSVRFSVYGFQADNTSPSFRIGSIMGTIGPQLAGEPLHLPPRLLLPTPASFTPNPLAWAPAKVDTQRNTVTIDLGNSIPDQSPGGPPVNIGTLEAATLSTVLGSIDYLGTTFQQTAGVVQFPITAEQAGQPLSILADGTIQLLENAGGLYIDVDGASVYMNPGDQASVNLWATEYGAPAAGVQVPLALVPNSPPSDFDNNQPASALSFPASVTTGANGSAPIPLQASDPSPLPAGRKNIGGQLYYLGGAWAAGNVWNGDSAGFFSAPLSVKLFNSIDPPITQPTWSDVQPILFKYYYLYAYMASIVDLSNYASVQSNAQSIQAVLNLSFDDPNYMPVTREMSNDERQLILTWIANGCPQGNDDNVKKDELRRAASPAPGDAAPRRRPWSGG